MGTDFQNSLKLNSKMAYNPNEFDQAWFASEVASVGEHVIWLREFEFGIGVIGNSLDDEDSRWIWIDVRPYFYIDVVGEPESPETQFVDIMTMNMDFASNEHGYFITL